MERLLLPVGLVLLAGTLPISGGPTDVGSIADVPLDFAPNSFDDRYEGCGRAMRDELESLNLSEFTSNDVYAKAWVLAAAEWHNRRGRLPPGLRPEQVVALLAYTQHGPLFQAFNAAAREAGRSRRHYLENFHFKTLHFLLSEALRLLRDAESSPRCYRVYRGVRGVRFAARRHRHVRFGQFTSTSLREDSTSPFGRDTFFTVETCYGVPIREFSFFPGEDEVLIPPFEVFKVVDVNYREDGADIELRSWGANSTYNCEWLKERRCRGHPCDFSAGWSFHGDPSLLWGLLVATTTLVATKGP
ncbi:GPI-linked NAD(P)(+)--arginine ADP-ribosyltransferase 1 [Phaenicophaeus curvirostris]|uniref:GPI-linked NAD(P)(+)--arginine ADP-ribosyltransferase 1 n=1 Tax=Phaenicophaeus curvirostris TaxID=33595 RepID=UPI0037F0C599